MARADNVIEAQVAPGAYPVLPFDAGSRELVFTPGDAAVGVQTPIVEGKTLVFVRNVNASTTARTVTFLSVVDSVNRKGDITAYSVPAGETHGPFGPFKKGGWSNGGNLWIDMSHAELEVAVVTLP